MHREKYFYMHKTAVLYFLTWNCETTDITAIVDTYCSLNS